MFSEGCCDSSGVCQKASPLSYLSNLSSLSNLSPPQPSSRPHTPNNAPPNFTFQFSPFNFQLKPLPSIPQQILITVNSDNFSVVVNVDIDGFALGICEAAISDSRPSTTVNILCSGIPCFHNVCIGELLSLP